MTARGRPACLLLSDAERVAAEAFTTRHPYACGPRNDFSIRYTATGVGTQVAITCHGCGQTEDVTDYASW